MVTRHLTDDEVQVYVLNKQTAEKRIVEHIGVCASCRAKVEVYFLLIRDIEQQPRPVFDFDLSASVLKHLQAPLPGAANDKLFTWILVLISAGFLAGGAYYFRGYLASIFEGVATILIYLIVISAITIIAGLV